MATSQDEKCFGGKLFFLCGSANNKAGYTAAEVACGWAGAVRVGRGRILGH